MRLHLISIAKCRGDVEASLKHFICPDAVKPVVNLSYQKLGHYHPVCLGDLDAQSKQNALQNLRYILFRRREAREPGVTIKSLTALAASMIAVMPGMRCNRAQAAPIFNASPNATLNVMQIKRIMCSNPSKACRSCSPYVILPPEPLGGSLASEGCVGSQLVTRMLIISGRLGYSPPNKYSLFLMKKLSDRRVLCLG